MRVLHLVHQYMPEKVGGTELYTQAIAQFQAAQGDEAAIFTLAVANGRFPQPELESGVRVYRVPVGARSATQVFGSSFGQREVLWGVTAVLRQERPDLVHIQHLMGLPANLVNRLNQTGVPYLVTLHDYWYVCANGQLITNDRNEICAGPKMWVNCGRCALARAGQPHLWPLAPTVAPVMAARHRLLQNVLRGARAIIAPTRFVAETYRQIGLPMEEVTIVPHGIEYPAVMPSRQREADGRLRVLFVGSLAWQKGVHVLLTAVNQLPPNAVELHIYGDLDTFPDYTAHLRQLSQHPGVQFHGRIARADLWRELVNADVGVLPTLWYEVSPLTIQEMFAAGLPIVASRIGAMPEKIADGVDGLLFPPGDAAALRDALARLLADGDLRARLRAGIGPVRTVAEHMGEVTAVYQQALAQRGKT